MNILQCIYIYTSIYIAKCFPDVTFTYILCRGDLGHDFIIIRIATDI